MKNNVYIINDFEGFVDSTRALVFNSFGKSNDDTSYKYTKLTVLPEEQEELDRVLSHKEASLIAKEILRKQVNKRTQRIRYLVSDIEYGSIIDAFHHRMIGNLLHGLVNKGLIESSYDEKINDFIFWIKDEQEQKQQEEEEDFPQTD